MYRFLLLILVSLLSFVAFADVDDDILWHVNYEEAKAKSKAEDKPMLLFFTGSDWCGWCMRLRKEVLSTKEFQELVQDKFVFVELDYPLYKKLDEDTVNQNEELRHQFNIRGYPTIVLLDPSLKEIGTTGYRRGGATAYANYLLQLLNEYQALNQAMMQLDSKQMSAADMQSLYKKARRFGRQDHASALLSAGIAAKKDSFFLLERYRSLVLDGKGLDDEALTIKEELLTLPVDTDIDTHYRVAVIDFGQKAESDDPKAPATAVLAPLFAYLRSVEHIKPPNLWKVHLSIAHVYTSKNLIDDAILHSEASLELAPEEVRGEIREAIQRLLVKKSAL